MTGISAALNTLANLDCKAALPEATAFNSPPKASFHLLKISFRAIFN